MGKNVAKLVLVLSLTGCQAFIENQTGSKLGYSPQQCKQVKLQCAEGHYQEWPTSDGDIGCSCDLSEYEQQSGSAPPGW